MAPPIEVSVLRAWDGMVVTAWWDPILEGETVSKFLNIRRFKSAEHSATPEVTLRLLPEEVEKLLLVIKHGTVKGMVVPK